MKKKILIGIMSLCSVFCMTGCKEEILAENNNCKCETHFFQTKTEKYLEEQAAKHFGGDSVLSNQIEILECLPHIRESNYITVIYKYHHCK